MRGIAGDFRNWQFSVSATGPLFDEVAFRLAGDLRYSHTTSKIDDRAQGADPNHDVYGLLRAEAARQAERNSRVQVRTQLHAFAIPDAAGRGPEAAIREAP